MRTARAVAGLPAVIKQAARAFNGVPRGRVWFPFVAPNAFGAKDGSFRKSEIDNRKSPIGVPSILDAYTTECLNKVLLKAKAGLVAPTCPGDSSRRSADP